MANLTSVTLTSGVPTGGTGTVGTIDNVTGTAGSPSVPVLTVQGVASGTAQPVSLATAPTTPVTGTFWQATQPVSSVDGGLATIGTTTDAAVVTDATGTVQQYLRGLVKMIAAGISVSISNANANIVALAGGTVAAGTAGAPVVAADQYSTHKEVGASATATVLGATGAIGDYLDCVTVYPGIAACGTVTILDGATAIGVFAGGGTTPLPSCIPFVIPVGAFCTGAGWHITTTTNVTVSCKGKFT